MKRHVVFMLVIFHTAAFGQYAELRTGRSFSVSSAFAFDYTSSGGGDRRTISPLFIQSSSARLSVKYWTPGRNRLGLGLGMAGAGVWAVVHWVHEIERGKEVYYEYRRAHSGTVAKPDGGGGGQTIQFWGGMTMLGGCGLIGSGVYFSVKGVHKWHRFNKEHRDGYIAPEVPPPSRMSAACASALRKKVVGITMVGAGVGLQVAGMLVWSRGTLSTEDKDWVRKALFAGTSLAVPGTMMWIVGGRQQNRYKDYSSIRTSSGLSFYLGPMPTLCYRF